jgi:hypothetical protein
VSSVSSAAAAMTDAWNNTARERGRNDSIYAELRNTLDPDDQVLLVLRVDRELAWREIAIVMLGDQAADEDVTRKAATLRKQFERVKLQLRGLAAERLGEK